MKTATRIFLLFLITATVSGQDLLCPIPENDRVFNQTGIQCVWASLETLGKWSKEPKLYKITSRPDCKGTAGPSDVKRVLDEVGIEFQQSYAGQEAGLILVKMAMDSGRACLFGYKHVHAMVLVHYDESANRVHFIDNSDNTLKVRIMTVKKFKEGWDGWVVVLKNESDYLAKNIHDRKIKMWYYKGLEKIDE